MLHTFRRARAKISTACLKMNPHNDEIHAEFLPLFRQYKSGRVERLAGTDTIPASVDPTTGVTTKDVTIVADSDTNISSRLYLPNIAKEDGKLPILVYYHGGGFCIESAFSPTYQPFLNSLSSEAGILVVSVNYRLAPEHVLPAAYDDSWAALKWVFSTEADEWVAGYGDLDRVSVAGDSAGGNIAQHMAMRAGESGGVIKLEGMILIHAYFWGSEPIGSETREAKIRTWMEGLWRAINSPGNWSLDVPWSNPMANDAPSLRGLGCRRVMVCVAEKDVLVERGKAYCEALKGSGWKGEVELVVSQGEDHVFHLFKPQCEKASELTERIVAFFRCNE